MKKNFYYLSLMLGLVFGMMMFTACGGDDDGDTGNGGSSGGGETGFVPGKFQGPKRVFGDNLLSSFGHEVGSRHELTYNSENFVSKVKRGSYSSNGTVSSSIEYEVSYSDKQVNITRNGEHYMSITIGSNGFAQTIDDGKEIVTFEYDSEGHVTRFTTNRGYIGTLTWQNGNMIKPSDNDAGLNSTRTISYNSTSNVAGLYVRASIGGDVGDFYNEMLYYMGLLGKGTTNLIESYSYNRSDNSSSRTSVNTWTLDAAGRAIKCVTVTEETNSSGGSSSSSTSSYIWNYR